MADQDEIIRKLRRELTIMEQSLHRKNIALDALHYVWCNGGCPGGVHRYTDEIVTEEMVAIAESEVRRLRQWFENAKGRVARGDQWCADKLRHQLGMSE